MQHKLRQQVTYFKQQIKKNVSIPWKAMTYESKLIGEIFHFQDARGQQIN